jgi:BirA family biotin operon repressor/biotin-[acetyl-CoA-carboxylase] ligase
VGAPWSDLERPPLRQRALQEALAGHAGVLTEVRVVAQTGSTHADVVALARAGAPEGTVLVAESQTAGRGRLDRAWLAPPRSGLTFSVLLRPPFPVARWSWLPLLAGLAVLAPVRRLGDVDAGLKWPNDVLVGERKLAGVLAERVGDAVVLGVGLNVSLRRDELPTPTATSLALEGSLLADRDPLLRAVLRDLADRYDRLRRLAGDPQAAGLRAEYLAACRTLGRRVSVRLPGDRRLDGEAVDVDADGRLVVRGPDGDTALGAGDVVHVR